MRVVLFALTGFGNKAIDSLKAEGVKILCLFTRKESAEFPYYKEVNISKYARSMGIPVYEDCNWIKTEKILNSFKIDLILVSTFNRILPNNIINKAPAVINIHPSYLPKHPGKNPWKASIESGEKHTGVTAHMLTDKVDCGCILYQKKIMIKEKCKEAELRKETAELSKEVIHEILKGGK